VDEWFLIKREKEPRLPNTKGRKNIGPIDIKISKAPAKIIRAYRNG